MSLGSHSLGSVSLGGSHVSTSSAASSASRPPLRWFHQRKANQSGTINGRQSFSNASAGRIAFSSGSEAIAREVIAESEASQIEMRAGSEFSPRFNPPGFADIAPAKFKGVKNLTEQEIMALIAAMEET